MSRERDPALDAAQRIADGESVDFDALEHSDPQLARGLKRLAAMAQALQPDAPAGETWGPLRQLEPIGAGAFGEVFRAFDPTLDRTVALKLRRGDAAGALPSGRDFIAEARRLARVRHPHVLAVHGAGHHDGRAGIWTDWIDGETLAHRIERAGPFEPAQMLRVATDLAAALRAVHDAGLVHADVKASNAMLDRDGRVILMDFGAGFERSDEGYVQTTGTPRYLAPEVRAGKAATSAVDVYALGVLWHRAACGDYPAEDAVSAAVKPAALRPLIRQMLDPEPVRRPTAAALEDALARVADAPRRRARQFALGAVIAGLAAVAAVSWLGYRRAEALRLEAVAARDQAVATSRFLTELLEAPSPDERGRDVKVAELLDAADRRARGADELAPGVRASLLYTVGASNLALNRLRAGDEALTEAARVGDEDAGLDPDLALRIRLAQSDARARRDHRDQAEAVLAAAAADPRWHGDVVATARIALQRGDNLLTAGRIDEAAAILTPALRDTPGLDPRTRVLAGWNLGLLYNKQGRHADAERELRETLVEADALGRSARMRSIWIRNELANSLNQQGKLADAEAVYREVVAASLDAWGERNLGSLGMRSNLSIALRDQGKFAEAEALQREMLQLATELDGADGRSAMTVRSALAVTLHESGRDADALPLFEENLPLLEREIGPKHPQTLIDSFNRVETLNALGRHADALAAGRALHPLMVEVTGPDHPFTLETEDAIGYALTSLGDAVQAEPMHRRTLELKTKMMGADTPYTLMSQEYLARALLGLGRRDEALAQLGPLVDARTRVLGADHPRTKTARDLLATANKR